MNDLVSVDVWGYMACFSMPEYSVERLSYPVPTPSAMQCLLGAIYAKRQEFEWEVTRIKVMKPIQTLTVRTNELSSMPNAKHWGPFSTTENRTQRYTTLLIDVEYIVEARPVRTWIKTDEPGKPRLGPPVNVQKHISMFNRRVQRGECFYRPFLGMSEFPAFFDVADPKAKPFPLDLDLGIMPLKIQYGPYDRPTRLFHAKLCQGVLTVPGGAA